MKRLLPALLALIAATTLEAQSARQTYVLVHGAWGGGWTYRTVDSMLTAAGYRVYRPTLTGLGERVHLATPQVGLSTHITDIVNVLLFENLRDVVLVGHSYGGMVVTGVADRVPERIRHLVFIDALVPEDGESLLTASRGTRLEGFARRSVESAQDGFIVPTWVATRAPRPTDVRQPVLTFTEPVSFKNPAAHRIPATYILTVEPGRAEQEDDFAAFGQRAKSRGWSYRVLRANHTPERSAPAQLTALLRAIP